MSKRHAVKACIALVLALVLVLGGAGYRQWTPIQEALHEAADALRAMGYPEDHPAILALQDKWREEEPFMMMQAAAPAGFDFSGEDWVQAVCDEFNTMHPRCTCMPEGIWTLCEMLTREDGDAQNPNGETHIPLSADPDAMSTYDFEVAVVTARTAINRTIFGTEFPNDVYDTIGQVAYGIMQYNTAYLTTYDRGYPVEVKASVAYALLFDGTIPGEYTRDGQDLVIPHSAFYHGNHLTGGYEWLRLRVTTSGGYTAWLIFGMDPSHCAEE